MSLQHPALARVIPFALFIGVLILEEALAAYWPEVASPWQYAVRTTLAALVLCICWRHYDELTAAPATAWSAPFVAVTLGLIVFMLWIALDAPWMHLPAGAERSFDPHRPDGSLDHALVAVRLGGSVLIVPLMEELFWRSFLARWIDRQDFLRHDPASISNKGLILSSTLFALEHHQWLAGLIAGFAYGGLYRATGNLRLPILAHGVTNLALGIGVIRTESWQIW